VESAGNGFGARRCEEVRGGYKDATGLPMLFLLSPSSDSIQQPIQSTATNNSPIKQQSINQLIAIRKIYNTKFLQTTTQSQWLAISFL
jgi:hypothetical protein